ncbi:MAG: C-GCAxxG-C-C family protein [Deltaproteobacteria bacterium]|nr:C-GCAxxG-C-C family protein [Deltaproteobacteria bacterium]
MTPGEMKGRAVEVFNDEKMLCSQAIVTAGLQFIGELEPKAAIRAAGGYAAGIGFYGDKCSCLIGALAVIGDLFGRADPEEIEDGRLGPTARTMYKRFREMIEEKRGTMTCSGASKTNWLDPEDVKAFKTDGRRERCGEIIGWTAEILGRVIIETIGENDLRLLQESET